jgi:hypothetical protein
MLTRIRLRRTSARHDADPPSSDFGATWIGWWFVVRFHSLLPGCLSCSFGTDLSAIVRGWKEILLTGGSRGNGEGRGGLLIMLCNGALFSGFSFVKSKHESGPINARTPLLEHEPHPQQRHDAGKSRPFDAAPNGLPLPAECQNPDSIGKAGRHETCYQICATRHRAAEIQNCNLRSRLFLTSASRLQKLHDANKSPGIELAIASRACPMSARIRIWPKIGQLRK